MLKTGDYVFIVHVEDSQKIALKITSEGKYIVQLGTLGWYSRHELRAATDVEILAAKLLGI